MADRLEQLFAELDRQLEDVRQQAQNITTRAGLLVTATGLAAGVLVADMDDVHGGEIAAFAIIGLATLFGFIALVPWLATGPATYDLTLCVVAPEEDEALAELFKSKVVVLAGNLSRLHLMTWAFYLQLIFVIAAVTAALVVSARR